MRSLGMKFWVLCQDMVTGRVSLLTLCQEIGLVALMFFFELLFSYVLSQFPSMFPLLIYSHSFFSLSADYPRHTR